MSAALDTGVVESAARPKVARSRRRSGWLLLVAVAVVAVLGYAPYVVTQDITDPMVDFFTLLILGTMWNVLAGYAGLVSVGQQAYIGIGAYTVLWLALHGVNSFTAIPLAAVVSGVIAIPVSFLLFRLTGGYFAIATWVVAEVFYYLAIRIDEFGGGTGANLPPMNYSASLLGALTYWASLAVAVLAVGGSYLLLRSRVGLALTAIRDNPVAAGSVGVRVSLAKRLVYVFACAGAGAAGALVIIEQLGVQPGDTTGVFGITYSAQMLFVVLIGGLGSLEGPILGTIVFFTLQQTLANYGGWYLIVVGLVAIVMAMYLRGGLWGLVERFGVRLFPVGYWVRD